MTQIVTLRYRRSPQALWRRVADGVLVLPPGTESPVEVSGPGAEVWRMLETDRGVDDVVYALARRFDVPPEDVAELVTPLLNQLVDLGAIEERG